MKGGQPASPRILEPLPLMDGVMLAMATAEHIGKKSSVRTLFVKGLSLSAHDLRHGHCPTDVDALVDSALMAAFVTKAGELGWVRRQETDGGRRTSWHSIALNQPNWPNDIDVHSEFPGLLVGRNRAFEILWRDRQPMTVAGQQVWIPDRASSIVIWALHSLKGTATQARHADELRQVRESVLPGLSEAERQELADRIVELGADEPLRVVPEFAEIIGDRHGPQAPGALEAWNAKVAQAHESTPWLQVLRDARPAERPWLLFRAVWPSVHDLRLIDEVLVDTPWGRVRSRGRRAWRLVRRIVERRRQAH